MESMRIEPFRSTQPIMKLQHLLSLRRYRRCGRIFRHPLHAHVKVAAGRRGPATIDLIAGQSLQVADVRECRPMFDWLLEQSADPLPVALENGLVIFHHAGKAFALPPNGMVFTIFKEIFADDVYGLNAVDGRLDTVVDLGGNIGLFAVRVAPLAQRVISVEPVEANLAMARQNIARAGGSSKITLHKGVVAATSGGSARIFLSRDNVGAHSIRQEHAAQWGAGGYEDVPRISLADLFNQHAVLHCSLLKCDVEGAEFEIFENAPDQLLARVDRIALEVHFTTGDWNPQRFHDLCRRFVAAGFHLEHEPLEGLQTARNNCFVLLATRQRPANLAQKAA
jgi:FkbM family methyltransferase